MSTPLITVEQLAALLHDPQLRLFDCRYSLLDASHGRNAYQQVHVQGARFVEVNKHLSGVVVPGKTSRHPLPAKAQWLATVAKLGITPETKVVLYDDGGGSSSARMWWMLKWIGHDNVQVLDGGWQAWQALGQSLSTKFETNYKAVDEHYSKLTPLVRLIDAIQVNGSSQLLLDARDKPRFRGEVEPIDPVAGHIPGAQCSPFTDNLVNGRFKSKEALREKFAVAVNNPKTVVCYCGSGITACHNILAMSIAELPLPALYAGSWSEWITDPSKPIAVGD